MPAAMDEALIRKAFCLPLESPEGIMLMGEAENGAPAVEQSECYRMDIVLSA